MGLKNMETMIQEKSLSQTVEKGDVLLMVSPMAWTAMPVLGVHLLQAVCRRAGIRAAVLYANLLYTGLMDVDLHTTAAMEEHYLLKERLFAAAAFGLPPQGGRWHRFFEPGWVPDHAWPKSSEAAAELVADVLCPYKEKFRAVDWPHLETLTGQWLDSLSRQIAGLGYPIVGCSTSMGGLVPAIALLRGVKKIAPGTITMVGGAHCEGEMAEGVLSLETGIDYIFSGEGESRFPALVRRILAGDLPAEKIICGERTRHLDTLPLPDYSEYFRQKQDFPAAPAAITCNYIPYETSRGCWFGKCTFCGLRGEDRSYRKKSPGLVLEDLRRLIGRHGMTGFIITDNIIPHEYIDTLFPRLAAEIPLLRLIFEVKANLTPGQLLILREAGSILIQPGIESLSTPLLRGMDKGVTARENIALLRRGRSLNLDLKWNLIFGFPGEQACEYEQMLHLLPLIRHLQPPTMMIPLRLYRFSRYQASPGEFGITGLRPAEIYRDLFPAHADTDKLAVLFTGEYRAASFENPGLITALYREYKQWSKQWASYRLLPLNPLVPVLHLSRKSPNEFILQDTRGIPGKPEKLVLDKEQAGHILTARPWNDSPGDRWAVAAGLGVERDSWFIPLATADPNLLQEFGRNHKKTV